MNERRDDLEDKVKLGINTLLTGYHAHGLLKAVRATPTPVTKAAILTVAVGHGLSEIYKGYKKS